MLRIKIILLCTVLSLGIGCKESTQNSNSEAALNKSEEKLDVIQGWLNWRGEAQAGISSETDLPGDLDENKALWTYEVLGAGTPVIANNRVFVFGFYGESEDLQETLLCLNADTGDKIWEHRFSDFLSDIIYNRYAIGAPTVDAETGNIYLMLSSGLIVAFDWNGTKLWERSMLEEFGRLTFPNGRTGSAVIDGERVIFRGITAAWGKQGPARDRFYAFDKNNGELLWIATPGLQPIDSSFSTPLLHDLDDGRRVFYSGTGCGHIVCVDARTGESLWRFEVSTGGVNATPALFENDKLIVIHGKENLDSSEMGRMICLKIPTEIPQDAKLPMVLNKDVELWRNNEGMRSFTSSPVVKDGIIYVTVATGELKAVDAVSGKTMWSKKLAPDQIHASPLLADNKLYVPMFDGSFYVIKLLEDKAEILSKIEFGEPCLGAPSVWAGRIYIHTKEKVYCFGPAEAKTVSSPKLEKVTAKSDEVKALQVIPYEFRLSPGRQVKFKVRSLDSYGYVISENVQNAVWEKYIPEGAKVKAEVDAELQQDGTLTASPEAKQSAGAIKADINGLVGVTRGRVLAAENYYEDFESFTLNQQAADEAFELSHVRRSVFVPLFDDLIVIETGED
ncbi:MAG: PQQ-binding-like beta-propeller repeat protein [Verrucomicrobiota bacterium]